MITCCIDSASAELDLFTAVGSLVDTFEKTELPLELDVEQGPVQTIEFAVGHTRYLFAGIEENEMKVLTCVFYLCCYIRCIDENMNFVDRDGSWRRLVARFALMSFLDIEFTEAVIQTQAMEEDAVIHRLVEAINGGDQVDS